MTVAATLRAVTLRLGDWVRCDDGRVGTVDTLAAKGKRSTFVRVWWLFPKDSREVVDADRLELVEGHTR